MMVMRQTVIPKRRPWLGVRSLHYSSLVAGSWRLRNLSPVLSAPSRLPPLLQRHTNIQRQQRRQYFFFPSDWGELTYRWKLFREKHSPTKVRIRLQDRYQKQKSKLQDNYQLQRTNISLHVKDRYQHERQVLRDRYQKQKRLFQGRYRFQRDQITRRYQNTRSKYRRRVDAYYQRHLQSVFFPSDLQQRNREFRKRWTARRRDFVRDSRDTVQQYWGRKRWPRQQQQSTPSNNSRHQVFTVEEYAQPHWFDPMDGRPLTSRDPAGRFVNPWMSWSTNGVHSVWNILHWRYQRGVREWKERGMMSFLPKDFMQMLWGPELAIVGSSPKPSAAGWHLGGETDNENPKDSIPLRQSQEASSREIDFTWIGHSTCLVKMGNATILTDPIFSHRCSPLPRVPGIGVARDVPPSMNLEDLPETIDVCLVSHDHYDHMDQLTISKLRDRVQHWVLPKGLPEWMESRCSVDPNRMTELEWWDSVHMVRSLVPDTQEHTAGEAALLAPSWKIVKDGFQEDLSNTMTITCLPAQHWSSRNLFDRCKRLWCGFAVETQSQRVHEANTIQQKEQKSIVQKFYFAGDTGMPGNDFPLFQQIGDFCGHGNYHRRPSVTTEQRLEGSDTENATVATTREPSAINATKNTLPFHPFDLAAIPIGAYEPAFLMQEAHMNPEEAVKCCKQLQARTAVAIHWGTFALSEEPLEEPPEKLKETLALQENEHVDFVALPVGGSLRVPSVETDRDT